jgi:hypothetical protein
MAFLLAGTPAEDDLNSYEGWISCTLTANSQCSAQKPGDLRRAQREDALPNELKEGELVGFRPSSAAIDFEFNLTQSLRTAAQCRMNVMTKQKWLQKWLQSETPRFQI